MVVCWSVRLQCIINASLHQPGCDCRYLPPLPSPPISSLLSTFPLPTLPLAGGVKVTLENRGEVEASYALVKPDTLFGPKFTFTPQEGILQPGGLQAIEVGWLECTYVLGCSTECTQFVSVCLSVCPSVRSPSCLRCLVSFVRSFSGMLARQLSRCG